MPPKGRGRGRGVPAQDNAQQPGRQPPGFQGQGPPMRQPQGQGPPQQGRQQPPGFQGQGPPMRQPQEHAQGPPQQGRQQPQGNVPGQDQQQPRRQQLQVAGPPQTGFQKPPEGSKPEEGLGLRFKDTMSLETPFPKKPPCGVLGRKIRLISNCYKLEIPDGNVYHYDIEIISKGRSTTGPKDPKSEAAKDKKDSKYRCLSTKRNREVILMMLRDNRFRNTYAAYDGRKNLYTRKPLGISGELKVRVVLEDENPGNPDDPRGPRTDNFEVVIRPVQKKDSHDCAISLDPLHELFAGRTTTVPQDAVMAIETVLRHGPCMRYTPVGRSFFYPPAPEDIHPLGGGKEIWFGYHQSMRLGQWGPMVNLDITATTFYEKGALLKYVCQIMGMNRAALSQAGALRDSDTARLSKELKNLRIETNHLRTYRRKYKVLRLTREPANRLEFVLNENGQQVKRTVAQYFATQYKPLEFPHLPCVQVNPETKKVYLPLEVCDVVEGQHCKKKLEERQNAEMIKFTARAPKQRFGEIRKILQRAGYSQDEYLKNFGIKVSNEPLGLEGRVLDAPNVRYDKERHIQPRDGQWDMRGHQYFRGAEISSWILLSFANARFCGTQQLEKFWKLLCQIASEQGIGISRPAAIEMIDNRRQNIQKVLEMLQKKHNADLAVVVVPATNKSIYGEVKQAAETILGLVTQCIKDDSVVKKCNPPLVSNLCQKINAKMGGVNNSLTPGETPQILRRPVIFIGADVTHPAPSHDIKPSIAAAVGSLDSHPSRYAVTLRAQTNVDEKKQSIEEILELKSMVLDLLKAFYRSTKGKKPEKIIFYRDGVSEGQFHKVRSHEVQAIRDACRTLEKDYEPGITFVVVQKRHHTRFMPQDDRQGVGKMKNIPPGTTVDNTVAHPLNFDFFLCSHFGLQGTSRPAHYTVIEDDNKFTADDLQKLTYYLCHTYVRCTKSISSPAPVMYAHLAAFRARQHLLSQIDESSASSDTSSSAAFHPLPEAVKNAIKVVDDLKNTMYFV